MRDFHSTIGVVLVVTVALIGLTPSKAMARLNLDIVTYGDVMYETGQIPAPWTAAANAKGYKAGYKCKHFGVLWADIARWDCTPVVMMDEETYATDAPAEITAAIAKKYSKGDMKMGVWKKHGRWIVGTVFLASTVNSIMKK